MIITPVACFAASSGNRSIAIFPVKKVAYSTWLAAQPTITQTWLQTCGMTADSNNKVCLLPDAEGQLVSVMVLVDDLTSRWSLAHVPSQLPEGHYHYEGLTPEEYAVAAIGWGLASYKFTAYKSAPARPLPQLVLPTTLSTARIEAEIAATYLVRDMVNTPAADMTPAAIGDVAAAIAARYDATVQQYVGDELLAQNFPAIHAVGRASAYAPRLIDMTWGDPHAQKIALVGKGVCFDSGGLDIKEASPMRWMKKDMGGAAHVLGLAQWIMALQLPVRLRVIIPAVENMIAGNAYRPGDVIRTRKGLTIEIGNTDAEGRVILADALALACEDNPSMIIDFATLTGAARVGLGPDIPNVFSNDPVLAQQLQTLSMQHDDIVWAMPLHKPYRDFIDSTIADISNDSSTSYGGALTAALFLNEFVTPGIPWVHLDCNAWNIKSRPGRPEGGEAMGLRTIGEYILKQG